MSSDNVASTAKTTAPAPQEDMLVNINYLPRYQSVLREHLPSELKAFAPFFANLNRLCTMTALLERHVGDTSRTILNAGCGPFAAEIFSVSFQNRRVSSFDYTKGFGDLYPVLRQEGHLATTHFVRGDANTIVYPLQSSDLIVFHDIFYEPALNVPDVLARFKTFLRPGGHIYLDYMNQSTAWLWRLLGKERQYKRYTTAQIRTALEENGFEILELQRSSGTNSRVVKLFNHVLWTVFRTSNAFALVARKRTSGRV